MKSTSFYWASLALLPVITCPPLTFAASQQQEESITVTASAATPYSVLSKMPLTPREIPQSVSLINQQQMQQQNLQTVEEVMRHATGITIQPHSHLTTAYYTRGFHIDSFEQNGVPVLMGETADSPEDTAVYERIEILRGVNGLLHGSGNPSATVNMVYKRPQRQFTISGELNAGRWDRYRGQLDLGGPLNNSGSLRARMVGVMEDRGFFYDAANQKTALFYAIGELDVDENTLLSLGLQYQRIRSHPPGSMGGVPRYSDGGDIGLNRSTNLESAGSRSSWNTTRIFAELEHRFAQDWNAKVSANYLTADSYMKYLTVQARGGVNRQTGQGATLSGQGMKFDNGQTSVDAYLTGSLELFGRSHELLFGGNIMHSSAETFYAPLSTPGMNGMAVDLFTWHPRNVPDYDTGDYESQGGATRINQQGIYGMGRLSLADPLMLVLGARAGWWQKNTSSSSQRISPQFTPYGGLIFDLNNQWSLYASYAQVFQPQSEKTRDGSMLRPITGSNYETGIKGELADGALNVSLALFLIEEKNRAMQEDALCQGRNCYYIADGKVRSQGVETEISGNITPDWMLNAGYTFNTSSYLTDSVWQGQSFASFAPRHLFRLWTDYALPVLDRRLSIGAGLQVQSAFTPWRGSAGMRQGGYALADVRLAWQVDKHVTLALNVNNLFDRVYYQRLHAVDWSNYYGEPRNFMLTVRADY